MYLNQCVDFWCLFRLYLSSLYIFNTFPGLMLCRILTFSLKSDMMVMEFVEFKINKRRVECRIAERTQIQVPGLNGRVEEPVKSQKTT